MRSTSFSVLIGEVEVASFLPAMLLPLKVGLPQGFAQGVFHG